MAGGGGGCSVGLCSWGAVVRWILNLSSTHSFLLPGNMAGWRDAVYLDHLPDFLSLFVLHAESIRLGSTLLDQYGRCRDLNPCRYDADLGCSQLSGADTVGSFPQGVHLIVL